MSVQTSGAISYYEPELERFKRISGNRENKGLEKVEAAALADDVILPNNFNKSFTDLLAGFGSGSGSGSGSGKSALGFAELEFKKKQDARDRAEALEALQFGRARDAKILGGFQNYYSGGKGDFNTGFDKLLGMITDQGKVSQQGVNDAYANATKNINEGYDAASMVGTRGFDALNAYLAANKNNPYAGMTTETGIAPDALTSYLRAYGVSDQPVQGQIAADQMQANQGAANFGNLANILGAIAEQADTSRSAESQMAQLLFNTGLGQDQAGYKSQASNAQAQALAALQQAMFQSRFGVEGDRNNLANQLVQTILSAGGSPTGSPTGSGTLDVVLPPEKRKDETVEELLQKIAAGQQAGTRRDPVLPGIITSNPFEQYAV